MWGFNRAKEFDFHVLVFQYKFPAPPPLFGIPVSDYMEQTTVNPDLRS
jgi:hypothetical protein